MVNPKGTPTPAPAVPTPSMMTANTQLKTITKEEVAKHRTMDDAWVTHCGYVYDVTPFIKSERHPGGNSVFEEYLGQDITSIMKDTDHSPFAYNLIKEFVVGLVEGEEQTQVFEVSKKEMRGYSVDDLRGVVDFGKPVLDQIVKIGDKYWPWLMNRPVCHDFVIFDTKFFEDFSRWPWWYIWVVFPPLILINSFWSLTEATEVGGAGSVLNWAASFITGVVMWTLTEYVLHRFVFHFEVHSNLGNRLHFFLHGVHHLVPSDSSRLTFPPVASIVMSYLFHKMFFQIVPAALFSFYGVYAGFALGFLGYDTAHFFFHHSDFDNKLFRYCKSAHLGHHYKNENMNFGVTSPLWDLVFGTYDPYNRTTDMTKAK